MMGVVARTPDTVPQPVLQRMRVRYAKRGRMRFASHRDFQRALERALRRAEVPMAYSAGFSPHPRISYAGAAPTGAASEAEYVEIGLARRCRPDDVRMALDAALPTGLDVLEVIEAGPGPLAERLEASLWRVEVPGVAEGELRDAVDRLLVTERVDVERLTKTGVRVIDARASLVSAAVSSDDGGCAILHVVVRHSTPAVRPDDVLAALRVVAHLAPPSPPVATRLAQGPLDEADGAVADPLAADRATPAPDV
jgi:radical SAM-linked protein